VRYFLVDHSMRSPVLSDNLYIMYSELEPTWPGLDEAVLRAPFARVAAAEHVDLYELPDVSPLAFRVDAPAQALPLETNGSGAAVRVPPPGGAVVVNLLARPAMEITIDGRPVAPGNIERDEWQRVRVRVPAEGGKVEVRYRPPWGLGLGFAAAIGALAWIWGRGLRNGETGGD